MTDKQCQRCGSCCRVLARESRMLDPEFRKYLLMRGLREDQGFILIPHECQHLSYKFLKEGGKLYSCDIHDSPDRPKVCSAFHGQKIIRNMKIYVPPECVFARNEDGTH